ncbi:redoxin domain-containing protein [bacterium]|nr:redoxin domain-containing protein [bacterium]
MKKIFKITILVALFALLGAGCGKAPSASVEPLNWDFGSVLPRTEAEQTISLENTGEATLNLDSLTTSTSSLRVLESPQAILPLEKKYLKIEFKAPADTGSFAETLYIFTDDPQKKRIPIIVFGEVLAGKLTPDNQKIVLIPTQTTSKLEEDILFVQALTKQLLIELDSRDDLQLVPADEIIKGLTQDPQYMQRETHELFRKWANILGIRFVLFTQLERTNSELYVILNLTDGYFKYPIARKIPFKGDPDPGLITATFKQLYANLGGEQQKIMQMALQKEWMDKRSALLNKPAPDFKLIDIREKKMVRLKDFLGKTVVLHFFSLECDACEKEMVWMERIMNSGDNVIVLGICIDIGLKEEVLRFIADKDISYPVLLPMSADEDGQLEPYYGGGTPITVVIDKTGTVRESLVGFSQKGLDAIEKMVKELN